MLQMLPDERLPTELLLDFSCQADTRREMDRPDEYAVGRHLYEKSVYALTQPSFRYTRLDKCRRTRHKTWRARCAQ